TLILEDAIAVLVPVDWHRDLPRLREDLGILDRGLVLNRVRIRHRVSLDDMDRIAVEGASRVEPRLVVEILHIDNERVAFPAAARVAYPEIDPLRPGHTVGVNRAMDLRPLERDRDVLGRLV